MTTALTSKMVLRTTLRRLIASQKAVRSNRFFHSSGCVAADALDMADTFPRRHCEFIHN
jgi:hypothetical protein